MVTVHKKSRKTKGDVKPSSLEPELVEDAGSDVASDDAETGQEQTETDPVPDTEALLAEANDKCLRAKAELDNYRRRTQREFAEIRNSVKLMIVQEFLPVLDHFQMALEHADLDASGDALKQGMEMIHSEFKRTFEALGITPVTAAGEPFDPTRHEAMAQEPSDDVPEGHILREWRSGFCMGERLVRPATVVVSSGPPAEDGQGEEAGQSTDS